MLAFLMDRPMLLLQYKTSEQIISHFGCTNIIFLTVGRTIRINIDDMEIHKQIWIVPGTVQHALQIIMMASELIRKKLLALKN